MTVFSKRLTENYKTSEGRSRIRVAVSLVYFCMGLSFSSWASRIPDIKTTLDLSDGALGSILLALPAGQFIMMPFSGRLATRYGSRKILGLALPLYTLCLFNIGLAATGWQLAIALLLFGLAGNLCNISVNTQGVGAERLYENPIMASFHGVWSLSGFTGAVVGLLMMNLGIRPLYHFGIIVLIVWTLLVINYPNLVKGKLLPENPGERRRFFARPDSLLLQLGLICFCCMACEGAMFDWSGVYFKDVVKVHPSLVVLGYTSFMIMMATGRFLADRIITRIGRKKLLMISGAVISSGLFMSVIFPYMVPCIIAFMMVGIGVSGVVPTVYSTAGRHDKIAPGMALAAVASVGFFGFLMGPPLIGHIAEISGLRYSFSIIGMFGLGITFLVSRVTIFDKPVDRKRDKESDEAAITTFGELP